MKRSKEIEYLLDRKKTKIDSQFNTKISYYLRLHAHDLSDRSIAEFLDVEMAEISFLKNYIEKQFKLYDWYHIIVEAFNRKMLDKIDFVDDMVVANALKCMEEIYSDFNKIGKLKTIQIPIKNKVLEFLNDTQDMLFRIKEKELERKSQKLIKKELLTIKMFPNSVDSNHMEKTLLSFFGTNTRFNAFRKAFQTNFFEKEEFKTLCEDDFALIASDTIIGFLKAEEPEKDKKSSIFHCLLKFYNIIEYDYLLKLE